MIGTFLNIGTVLAGTAIGVTLGNRLPERVRESVLNGLGLGTIGYAVLNLVDSMSGQQNVPLKFITVLLAVVIGVIAGELIDIDKGMARFGGWLERASGRMTGQKRDDESTARFVRGYVAASLLFCVGPMTILGSIQDGLTGDYSTIAIKSTLDFFSSLAYGASLGIGVGFSALTILVVQGGLTLTAGVAQNVVTKPMLAVLSATGALLIIGIGLSLLELRKIRLANFLPSLLFGPVAVAVMHAVGVSGF